MNYWIIINETEQGPYTVEELAGMELTARTPVWCEGMPDWVPLETVAELAALLPAEQVETPAAAIISEETAESEPEKPMAAESVAPETTAPTAPVIYAPADAVPPGYVAIQAVEPKCPPTYLVLAIICTIVCFLPLGVCAIICSTKVRKHFSNADYEKAARMSERTALFIILSLVVWLIWMPFSILFAMM